MTRTLLPAPDTDLGTILHIGAGTGGDLAAYLATRAETVVLVEPDEQARAILSDLMAGLATGRDRVTLLPLAIAAQQDEGPDLRLNRFNFADLNSLRDPAGILTLFPGLELLTRDKVRLASPDALIDQIALSSGRPNWLVIEAPGEEAAILQALAASGQLARFETLLFQGATGELFAGQLPVADLLDWLVSVHFSVGLKFDATDPDRPYIRIGRNQASAERDRQAAELGAALGRLQDALEMQTQKLAEQQSAAASQQQAAYARAESDKARIDTLGVERQALAGRMADMVTDLETRAGDLTALRIANESLSAEKSALIKRLQDAESQAQSATERVKEAETRSLAAETRVKDAEARAQDALARMQVTQGRALQAEARHTESAAQLTEVRDHLHAAEANLARLRQDHDVMTKERDTARSAASDAVQKQRTAHVAELAALRAELAAQTEAQVQLREGKLTAAHAAELAERDGDLLALQTELAAARLLANAEAAQRSDAEARETALKSSLDAARSDLEVGKGRIASLTSELEKKSRETGTARQDLSLALRNHALTQGDLHELQARYQAVNEARARQEDLLRKLTQRLGDAAQMLQALSSVPAAALPGPMASTGPGKPKAAGAGPAQPAPEPLLKPRKSRKKSKADSAPASSDPDTLPKQQG